METITGLDVAPELFGIMGFDVISGEIVPSGKLAIAPQTELRALTFDMLRKFGLSSNKTEAALSTVWQLPHPVTLAQPITDLATLFGALRALGIKIAVATSDDRAPTQATLSGLGLASLVDALACADDGPPIKPAPDMILIICRTLNIPPAKAVMIGDNADDLRMGRAAGVGLVVGVLSGISPAADLLPYADILLDSVAGLVRECRSK